MLSCKTQQEPLHLHSSPCPMASCTAAPVSLLLPITQAPTTGPLPLQFPWPGVGSGYTMTSSLCIQVCALMSLCRKASECPVTPTAPHWAFFCLPGNSTSSSSFSFLLHFASWYSIYFLFWFIGFLCWQNLNSLMTEIQDGFSLLQNMTGPQKYWLNEWMKEWMDEWIERTFQYYVEY
jgi:hypothetical protein